VLNNDVIELINVSKVFSIDNDINLRAVDNISLKVNEGEIILVAGPNGSGKTTLLTLIGCMVKPTEGTIKIFKDEVTHFSQAQLTSFRLRNIGFIFQTFRLLDSLTVTENVELIPCLSGMGKMSAKEKTYESLEKVKIKHKSSLMPWKLSGGEKQRVAIARAIVNDPPLILADEPTGSLDSKSGQTTIELLCSIAKEKGKTVIIVSHDERIRHYADRILMMEDGKIIF
jgi:putative ABC transport system ATP-binding protein